MLRLVLPIFLLLAGLLGLAWAMNRPLPKADFTFINHGDVSTLDPAIISWQQDNRVARMISEGLTRADIFSKDFSPLPAAAERWDVSADKLVYTFHLRADAKWSNGEALTAEHFKFSWRRSMMPELAGDYIRLFSAIKGGDAFIAWRAAALKTYAARTDLAGEQARRDASQSLWNETLTKWDELVGVRVLDERTLRVTLARPTPYFLDLTGFPPMFPLHASSVERFQSIDPMTGALRSAPDWTKPPFNISNGPYRMTHWRFKRDMRFEKNEHYWDRANVAIASINVPAVADPNAEVLAFTTGGVDFVTDVVPGYRAQMLARKREFYDEHAPLLASLRAQGITDVLEIDRALPRDPRNFIHVFPAFGSYFYNFNCAEKLADGRPNPFHDPLVRRAFALCLDKESIARDIRRVGEQAANTLVPRDSLPGYQSPRGLGFDPALARRLLEQAGYANVETFPLVEILFNKDSGHDLIAQSVAKDWERHLGVKVQLRTKETKTFRESVKNGDFMVSRAAWFGDYNDPTTFLYLNRTGDGNNDRKYSNPAYDALLDHAENEPDTVKRLALLTRAETMIVEEDMPLVPIFQYVQLYLFDPHKVGGISAHPRMEVQASRIHLTDTPTMPAGSR